MIRLGLLVIALSSCNQWVRPRPPPDQVRSPDQQQSLAVKVESTCDPFNDGGKGRAGSGVMVSDWQVLTALHVVDCQSAIATIYVTNNKGKRWRFSPEKEWRGADISRIQMASADTFHRKISPPRLRLNHLTRYEPVYIQAGHPKREEVIGQSTGWSYGGNGYGEPLAGKFSYRDAATQPGNSGAGVYDREGQLVGIHVEHADGTKLGYASYVTEEMIPR